MLWAVQNGYVDQVPVERVKDFQLSLMKFLKHKNPTCLRR